MVWISSFVISPQTSNLAGPDSWPGAFMVAFWAGAEVFGEAVGRESEDEPAPDFLHPGAIVSEQQNKKVKSFLRI